MKRIEKTIFISYRRTNIFTARAVYDNLTRHGYDVFFDFENIDSGDFSQIILRSIESRAHFILILTPSALERCHEPNDWLRREIEHAIEHKRNIVPLVFEGFDYSTLRQQLPSTLAQALAHYNSWAVPAHMFEDAMRHVRERFLNIELETVLHPVTGQAAQYEQEQQRLVTAQPVVSEDKLEVETLVERALEAGTNAHYRVAIDLATDALLLDNHNALALSTRGINYSALGDHKRGMRDVERAMELAPNTARIIMHRGNIHDNQKLYDAAIRDYTEAINLEPAYATPYHNRGLVYRTKGEYDAAIRDYTEAIRLQPDYARAYNNRGIAYYKKGAYDAAIRDYTKAIHLQPNHARAYNNRGLVYRTKGEYDAAIRDYTEAIRLQHDYADAYNNRGTVYGNAGDYDAAIHDFEKALALDPNVANAANNLRIVHQKRDES